MNNGYKYTDNKQYTFSTKSQQPKREVERDNRTRLLNFSFGEWFVEKMLRDYEAVYKYITLTIHQINVFTIIIKSV